eukprot:GFUD01036741.1.p1 GENE.GFUD01036741.1~~GFUD01036741.1.p1  ORF type:complete len:412 (+),score=54.04 GFUD01036741.1:154-1236(+)
MDRVLGAAQYCCVNFGYCYGFAKATDEPFLLWPQSSADTFPILKEGSDELTSVNSTEISDVDQFLKKATFIFRAGMCRERSTVSIESQSYPGKYWRHQNSIMKLHSKDETNLFKEDSCFKISQGDCNDGSFTLESVNNPGYFIQKCDSQMKIRTEVDNCGDVSNKCWVNPVSLQASLAYCSTKVTDELSVAENPECCDHQATLEEFGGCCLEIMNGNKDGCYEMPNSPPTAPAITTEIKLILDLWYCPKKIHSLEHIAKYPTCCLHPSIRRMFQEVSKYCCDNYDVCFRKRKKRTAQGCLSTTCSAIYYCPGKMRVTEWYKSYEECCCHPFRNWMFKNSQDHSKLYNQECKTRGHPDLSG